MLRSTFMPAGYPKTVGPLYLKYSFWSAVTNVAVSANSVLASTFMLYAVGLGAGAIPTAGAMNWVLKDGIGQLGTLVFGKQIAHNFDVHSKSWFFLSMVQLKVATGVELMTLLFPHHFLLMGSLANAIKGTAIMASGSTRSVFNLSFAADNNIADITAKGTSQYILASFLGTAAGATLCTQIGQDLDLAMAAYSVLTTITLYASYATVKSIPLATLNSIRLQLVAEAFLTSITRAPASTRTVQEADSSSSSGSSSSSSKGPDKRFDVDAEAGTADFDASPHPDFDGSHTTPEATDRCYVNPHLQYDEVYDDSLEAQVPTPKELAAVDPPLPRLMGDVRLVDPALHVGTDIEVVADSAELLVMLLSTFKDANHILVARGRGIHIILREEADARDIVKAYLQLCRLEYARPEYSNLNDTWMLESLVSTPFDMAQQLNPMLCHRRLCRQAVILRKQIKGGGLAHTSTTAELHVALQESLLTSERLTTIFMAALSAAGWRMERVVVEANRFRATW
ncbi:MAG: hypothetical protein WDW36_009093 [Sanguina aurantia]